MLDAGMKMRFFLIQNPESSIQHPAWLTSLAPVPWIHETSA
jgi:hypothetical protein